MSRIGKAPIPVPQGVTVSVNGSEVTVKGPKGELKRVVRPEITVKQDGGSLLVQRSSESRNVRSLHGLTRTLVANMVHGVTQGFQRNLDIVGVGYRAAVEGKTLVMQLGYSHQVDIPIPQGLAVTVTKNTALTVVGADKQQLGDFCAYVRDRRPPEVYKGKGVKYSDEVIRRKAGKAAGKKK